MTRNYFCSALEISSLGFRFLLDEDVNLNVTRLQSRLMGSNCTMLLFRSCVD